MQVTDLERQALETIAVEGYRTGALTEEHVRRLLGFESRFAGHALLEEQCIPLVADSMNADLHMAEDLENTGKGNLFVIFGEPDIEVLDAADGQVQVKIKGVDVFHPGTGEVRSDGPEGIACWFIDTDYNEESFFVRHAATGNHVDITLAMQPIEAEKLPIIFDIEVSDPRVRSPEEWRDVREAIASLRRLKNRVFEGTLTESCLNLFQQP